MGKNTIREFTRGGCVVARMKVEISIGVGGGPQVTSEQSALVENYQCTYLEKEWSRQKDST